MNSYFVPLTSVDFAVWEQIDVRHDITCWKLMCKYSSASVVSLIHCSCVQGQAEEVQTGLSLLVQALSAARNTVSSSPLISTLDNNISNMHSLSQILHSLHLQVCGFTSIYFWVTWNLTSFTFTLMHLADCLTVLFLISMWHFTFVISIFNWKMILKLKGAKNKYNIWVWIGNVSLKYWNEQMITKFKYKI